MSAFKGDSQSTITTNLNNFHDVTGDQDDKSTRNMSIKRLDGKENYVGQKKSIISHDSANYNTRCTNIKELIKKFHLGSGVQGPSRRIKQDYSFQNIKCERKMKSWWMLVQNLNYYNTEKIQSGNEYCNTSSTLIFFTFSLLGNKRKA